MLHSLKMALCCLLLTPPSLVAEAFDHTHSKFAEVLRESVVESGSRTFVRYQLLKDHPQKLGSYLERLSRVTQNEYEAFNSEQKLSFLINAYNAFTLKLIADNYPVKTIRKIGGLFGSPWKISFFSLLGEKRHLDEVEHGLIRKYFDEPRIHFAVNCASIGCPVLSKEPYVASKLEAQLARAAKVFLADSSRNRVEHGKSKTVVLSKIFDWYGDDFRKNGRTLETFLAENFPRTNSSAAVLSGEYEIEYSEYDWSLNDATQ